MATSRTSVNGQQPISENIRAEKEHKRMNGKPSTARPIDAFFMGISFAFEVLKLTPQPVLAFGNFNAYSHYKVKVIQQISFMVGK